MEGVLGLVACFAGTYAPRNWLFCDGQELQVTKHKSLYQVLGNKYGGVADVTFKLPDLRGRTAVSAGQSPFHTYKPGEAAGTESLLTLHSDQMPVHTHSGTVPLKLPARTDPGIDPVANDGYPSEFTGAYATSGDKYMAGPDYKFTIEQAGAGVPVNTRSAFQVVNYIICVQEEG